ncbi:MAG: hypothetical protein WBP81_23690 [Solirubrobacteraceae bacterium]
MLQATLDRDLAPLREVLAADLGLAAEDGDVDEVGAAVLTVAGAEALGRGPQPSDLGAAPVVKLPIGGETADEVDWVESGLSFHQVYVEFVGQGLVRCRALGARIAGAPAEIAADAPPARRLGAVLLLAGGVVAIGGLLVGAAAEADASHDMVLGAAGAVVGFPVTAIARPLGRYLAHASALEPKVAMSMNSGGWSFWSLTSGRMSQTLRPSPSCLRTGSLVKWPTRVTTWNCGGGASATASVVMSWPLLSRWTDWSGLNSGWRRRRWGRQRR